MPEVVHQNVSHKVDVLLFGACLAEVPVGTHAGGEEDVRKSVGYHSVHFLGHIDVERAYTRHQVCYLDAFLACHDGACHRGGEVIDHHHQVGGMFLQFLCESHDDACQALEEVVAFHFQASVGPRHIQVLEERVFQALVLS